MTTTGWPFGLKIVSRAKRAARDCTNAEKRKVASGYELAFRWGLDASVQQASIPAVAYAASSLKTTPSSRSRRNSPYPDPRVLAFGWCRVRR